MKPHDGTPLTDEQTLYIYFGVAILVGAITGVVLHFMFQWISKGLGLDISSEEQAKVTIASYRAGRAQKKAAQGDQGLNLHLKTDNNDQTLVLENSDLARLKSESLRSPIGLLSTTILEEDDSSGVDFG